MGATERSKNLTPSSYMLTTRHHSHFAGARSLHQALTQELPHWALVLRSAGVPLQAYHSRKTSCDVQSYRHHRGQFSALWAWATLTHRTAGPSTTQQRCSLTEPVSHLCRDRPEIRFQKSTTFPELRNRYIVHIFITSRIRFANFPFRR